MGSFGHERPERLRKIAMEYTFFGIQLVIKTFPGDGLRARLHRVIAEAPADQSLADKRELYKRFTTPLIEALPMVELGFWDYIPRPQEAEHEFDKWCSEIEKEIATPNDPADPSQAGAKREYISVTLAFLLQRGGNSDLTCASRCDIAEPYFFTRGTFAHLIATVPMLSFASVRSDAIYLLPGTDQDGFTAADLQDEGWSYLRRLT
jgi:hypothetical protein